MMNDLAVAIAVLTEKQTTLIDALKKHEANTSERLDKLEATVSRIEEQSNRWKGGLLVIVGLGGFLTAILSSLEKIAKFFH